MCALTRKPLGISNAARRPTGFKWLSRVMAMVLLLIIPLARYHYGEDAHSIRPQFLGKPVPVSPRIVIPEKTRKRITEKLKFGYKRFKRAGKVMYWTLPETVRRAVYNELQSPRLKARLMSLPNIMHKNATEVAEIQRRQFLDLDKKELEESLLEIQVNLNRSRTRERVIKVVRHNEKNLSSPLVSLALSRLANNQAGEAYARHKTAYDALTRKCAGRLLKRAILLIKKLSYAELQSIRGALVILAEQGFVWFPYQLKMLFRHWEDRRYRREMQDYAHPVCPLWTKSNDTKFQLWISQHQIKARSKAWHLAHNVADNTNFGDPTHPVWLHMNLRKNLHQLPYPKFEPKRLQLFTRLTLNHGPDKGLAFYRMISKAFDESCMNTIKYRKLSRRYDKRIRLKKRSSIAQYTEAKPNFQPDLLFVDAHASKSISDTDAGQSHHDHDRNNTEKDSFKVFGLSDKDKVTQTFRENLQRFQDILQARIDNITSCLNDGVVPEDVPSEPATTYKLLPSDKKKIVHIFFVNPFLHSDRLQSRCIPKTKKAKICANP